MILQGRYITHQALRALGAQERITSVTSFRPRSPFLKDDTVLTTVRPISELPKLYHEFGEYRLTMLEERLRMQLRVMRDNQAAGKKLDVDSFKSFLKEQQRFLERTDEEIVEEDKVKKGFIDEFKILNAPMECADETMKVAKRVRVD